MLTVNTMVNRSEEKLDRVFQALANPTRRRILLRVAQSSCTVAELAKPFSISAPGISRHLKVLENAQMIERVKVGKFHRFRVNTTPLGKAQLVLRRLTEFWNQRLDELDDFLQDEIKKTN